MLQSGAHAGAYSDDDLAAGPRPHFVVGGGLHHLLHPHIHEHVGLGLVLPASSTQ